MCFMHTLRFDGEPEEAFRSRAERAGTIAKILVEACLENHCMQDYIYDLALPFITEESVKDNPTVRIEYEQAIAFGGIGETLEATRSKWWGDGPYVLPLAPDDFFFATRITYQYRENSLYNKRYEQRMRLKELLGRKHRKLVGEAKYHTKRVFLSNLTERQKRAIWRILKIDPGLFWQACRGRRFLTLPSREVQRELPFSDNTAE